MCVCTCLAAAVAMALCLRQRGTAIVHNFSCKACGKDTRRRQGDEERQYVLGILVKCNADRHQSIQMQKHTLVSSSWQRR